MTDNVARGVVEPQDAANLYWMAIANGDGVGLFYPTVCRHGEIPEMRGLLEAGLCTYQAPALPVGNRWRMDRRAGYWLTDKGRAELSRLNPKEQPDAEAK